jgi:8-oxo-dGTP diphosphatase
MKLRALCVGELDQFVELIGSTQAQRPAFERAQARGELFILTSDGRLSGGVVLSQRDDPSCTIFVARELSGHPLDEETLTACEEFARMRGCELVRLDCVASNDPLARYYQQRGYYPRGVAVSGDALRLRHDKRLVTPPWTKRGPFVADSHATLMFIERNREVLLIRKKRGHGAGKINGPGGMVERRETPLQCAVRETAEEVGVRVLDAAPLAELHFYDTDGSRMLGVAFKAVQFQGAPVETAEAAPFWCPIEQLPYAAMWEDDVLWLPWLLRDRPVVGSFLMQNERLLSHWLEPTSHERLYRLAAAPVN